MRARGARGAWGYGGLLEAAPGGGRFCAQHVRTSLNRFDFDVLERDHARLPRAVLCKPPFLVANVLSLHAPDRCMGKA